MKPIFAIRCFASKKLEDTTYLALVAKIGDKTCFVTFDEALLFKLCDFSILSMLKAGEEIEI